MGEIDTWYVGSKEINGLRFRIDIEPDTDVRPDKDYDCYDADDIKAWKEDRWRFVGVIVTPEYKGHAIRECADSLWAVEWGELPGASVPDIGREYFETNHPLPDMFDVVMENLRGNQLDVEIMAAHQSAETHEHNAAKLSELKSLLKYKAS